MNRLRLSRIFGNALATLCAFRNQTFFYIIVNFVPSNLILTFDTSGCGKRAVALYNVFREHACVGLDIVDILGVVGKQFSFILKQPDKPMSW